MKSSYRAWTIVLKAINTIDRIAIIFGCDVVERCVNWKMHQEYHRTLHLIDCYKWY